mmetsp:Transcript_11756/g.37348  ORF Transcript_11756/g.37348 Transcript_11756/m.37348 type:complete len:210 (+) Transcript_11756:243-872(+)
MIWSRYTSGLLKSPRGGGGRPSHSSYSARTSGVRASLRYHSARRTALSPSGIAPSAAGQRKNRCCSTSAEATDRFRLSHHPRRGKYILRSEASSISLLQPSTSRPITSASFSGTCNPGDDSDSAPCPRSVAHISRPSSRRALMHSREVRNVRTCSHVAPSRAIIFARRSVSLASLGPAAFFTSTGSTIHTCCSPRHSAVRSTARWLRRS